MVLTLTEFGILRTLLRRPGRVCTRDILMNEAYELHKIVSDRTIDSHVRRVRAKFAALVAVDPIETVHGVGYKLGPCA
jgi:two-component system OmpR family response regulator